MTLTQHHLRRHIDYIILDLTDPLYGQLMDYVQEIEKNLGR